MKFVSTSIYRKATKLALNEGLSPDAIAHHQILLDNASDAPYVPIDLLWELYELADQHLAEGFGLRHGQQMVAEDYGTLGLSWKTCWTARDVFKRTERYLILVTNHGSIEIEEEREITKVHLFRPPHRKGLETSNEATFVMIAKIIRDVTDTDIHPILISFQHGFAENVMPYSEYFKCPVQFDQEKNALHFKTADLETPTVKADKSIHRFLVERMEEEAEGIHVNANKLVQDVQSLIKEALPSGIPSVTHIGKHLGMSNRTLKRRLTESGFTFRKLVKDTQEDISIELLKNTSHSIGEIAFQTGYSEQSAFNRAFKRWTGQSPIEFRKTL